MKLWRKAAYRSSSWQPLLKENRFWPKWSSTEPAITFESIDKQELNMKGRYDHQVEVSLSDICALLETLSTDAIRESPELVESGLAGTEDALIRILACIKGLKPAVPLELSDSLGDELTEND
jgi:hypothetical protein